MNCFPCFRSQRSKKAKSGEFTHEAIEAKSPEPKKQRPSVSESSKNLESNAQVENNNINAQTFTFRELASATRNFRKETLLGEGGFGRVYKGTLPTNGQVVAVKQLDRNGLQGNKEFLVEVLMLSQLHHEHLVKLVGYCADGDQRLLVYEYMPGGSVEDHLLDLKEGAQPLDWKTRMKIAFGAAQGLQYLHDTASPPVIYRDLKSSNILLCENFHPKLSDFGLAKLSPAGDSKMHMSSWVMGTYGYCAPEYSRNGNLTIKSDVYSFGVVLLELITGRRAIDTTKPVNEQNLVSWAQPIFRDPKRFPDMADPLLDKQFPETALNQAVAIAAMCLQEEPGARPLMSDVMMALSFLANAPDVASPSPSPTLALAPAPPPAEEKSKNNDANDQSSKHSNVKDEESESSNEDKDGSEYDDYESGELEDANSATNSEVDHSGDYTDSSDYQETENIVDEPTEENKDEHHKSIKRNSISSRKHSRKRSIRKCSSGNESSKNNSQHGSNISSDRSSSGSEKSKSKKSPLFSLSRKSSKGSQEADGSSKSRKKPHAKSLSSKSYRKSKKTKDVPAILSLKKPLDVRDSHKSNHQGLSDVQQAELR